MKKKHIEKNLIIIFLFLSFFVFSLSADGIPVKVAITELDGFSNKQADGSYRGYCIDYLNNLKKYENFEYEYIYGDLNECMNYLKTGEADIFLFTTKNPEMEKDFRFSNRTFSYTNGVLYSASKVKYFDDFENYNKKTIAFVKESGFKARFDDFSIEKGFSYFPKYYDSEQEMNEALKRGDVDFLASVNLVNHDDLYIASNFPVGSSYIISGKNNKIMDYIDSAMSELKWDRPNLEKELFHKFYGKTNQLIFTREESAFINKEQILKVGYFTNLLTLVHYDEETDGPQGFAFEIMELIKEESGLKLEYIPLEMNESYPEALKSKKIDIALGMPESEVWIQDSDFIYCGNLIDLNLVYVVKKGVILDLNSALTITYPESYSILDIFLKRVHPNWKIIYTNNFEDRLNKVISGEADCTISDENSLQFMMTIPQFNKLSIQPAEIQNSHYSIVASNLTLDPIVISIIKKTISYIGEDQFYFLINKNLISSPYQASFLSFIYSNHIIIELIFLFLLILFSLMGYFNYRTTKKNKQLDEINRKINSSYYNLTRAELEAKKANSAKSEFLSRMSHDMRTPLGAIIGLSGFGMDEEKDEKINKYFYQIKDNAKYLLSLLNDILDTQKLGNKNLILENSTLHIEDAADRIVTVIKTKAENKGITLNIDLKWNSTKFIKADEKRVEQLLINILNNAVKYTPAGGTISWRNRVEIKENSKLVVYNYISDTGVGMSQKFQNHMYETFAKETNSQSRFEEGMGLGLPIVKKIVDALGGTITCKSELGKGTLFTIILSYDLATEEEIKEYQRKAHPIINKSDYKFLERKKVLLCEDNELNIMIAKKILENWKMDVDIARNGNIGVEMAKSNSYFAILMDIRMPVMDGLQASREIREFDQFTPILALSANAYQEDVQKSLKAGMNGHLAKPIKTEVLFQTLIEFPECKEGFKKN